MRTIKQTTAFKRDLKRASKGRHREYLAENFVKVVQALAEDEPLDERFLVRLGSHPELSF